MVKEQDTISGVKTRDNKNVSNKSIVEPRVRDTTTQGSDLDYHHTTPQDEASRSTQFKATASTKHYPVTTNKHRPSEQKSQRQQSSALSTATAKRQPASEQQQQPSKPTQPQHSSANMSKLSPALKQLINAPFSKPSTTTPNLSTLQPTINKLVSSAQSHNVSTPAWLTFTTATAMTMNSPTTLTALWQTATSQNQNQSSMTPVTTAELQREVGLKCISFNGIPRAINCLGAFYGSLPKDIQSQLSTKSTREYDTQNITQRKSDGLGLWDSVYAGFERKLLNKLSQSHPDLPVHILNGHYASLLSNPTRTSYVDGSERSRETQVGRVLTSLVAIACLRAQTGVGPQVVSHVFGLRKAYENGDAEAEGEVEVGGGRWLAGEEGNKWLLESIDELVRAIGTGQEGEQTQTTGGTTFAPGIGSDKLKAKL